MSVHAFAYIVLPAFSLAVLFAGLVLIGRRPGWLGALAFAPAAVCVVLLVWMLTTQEQSLLASELLPFALVPIVGAALWGALSHRTGRRRGRLALAGLALPLAAVALAVAAYYMAPSAFEGDSFNRVSYSGVLGYRGRVYVLTGEEASLLIRWQREALPSGCAKAGNGLDIVHTGKGIWRVDSSIGPVYVIAGRPDVVARKSFGGGYIFHDVYRLSPSDRIAQQGSSNP